MEPNEIIAPAPTMVDNLLNISPTITDVIQTPGVLLVQQTPAPVECNNTPAQNRGLIIGVAAGAVFAVAIIMFIIAVILILVMVKKKKAASKFPRTYNSRHASNSTRERCKITIYYTTSRKKLLLFTYRCLYSTNWCHQ